MILIIAGIFVFIIISRKITVTEKKGTNLVTSKIIDLKKTGLRIYKPEKSYNGYTLFAHLQTNLQTEIYPIYLIDMKGNIVKQWMSDVGVGKVQLRANGSIVFNSFPLWGVRPTFCRLKDITPQILKTGLYELDSQSNISWYYPGLLDHDFQVLSDGNFLIDRQEFIYKTLDNDMLEVFQLKPIIEIITPDKKVNWTWRGDDHVKELENLIGLKVQLRREWAHNNACEIIKDNPLGKKDPRFQKGNIIFSYCHLDTIGIIDYLTGEIVWAWGPGILEEQHAPTMLDNGNLLIFDNGVTRDWARIIELNPLTEEIVWEYHAEPKKDLHSGYGSNASKLPNGNILICVSDKNQILEITPEGEIVWDFISTFNVTNGLGGIYQAYRYSPEYVKDIIN